MRFSDAHVILMNGGKVTRRIWREVPRFGGYVEKTMLHAEGHQGAEPAFIVVYPDGWRLFSGANWDLQQDDWEIAE